MALQNGWLHACLVPSSILPRCDVRSLESRAGAGAGSRERLFASHTRIPALEPAWAPLCLFVRAINTAGTGAR